MTDTDPTKTTPKKTTASKPAQDETATEQQPAKAPKHTPVNDDQDATVGTAPAKQPAADGDKAKTKPEA